MRTATTSGVQGAVHRIRAEDLPAIVAGNELLSSGGGGLDGLTQCVADLLRRHGPVPLVPLDALDPGTHCAAVGVVGAFISVDKGRVSLAAASLAFAVGANPIVPRLSMAESLYLPAVTAILVASWSTFRSHPSRR